MVSNILCRYRKKIKAIGKKKDCPVIQKCKKSVISHVVVCCIN